MPHGSAPPPRGAQRQERGQRAHRHRGVAKSCDEETVKAVKAAERAVRDVVVLRCCAPGGVRDIAHGEILKALEVAFDRPLESNFLPHADRELRAMLLLAFHKVRRDA